MFWKWNYFAVVIFSLLTLAGCEKSETRESSPATPPAELTFAVASNAAPCLEALVSNFENPGAKITVSSGASGTLVRQIREGAPFDIFFSADTAFVDQLISENLLEKNSRKLYARGTLVLVTSVPEVKLKGDPKQLLMDHPKGTIAIANPSTAPYGVAASEFMKSAGIWDAVQDRIVMGENISQPLQFVRTGNASFGFTAKSLVIQGDQPWMEIPGNTHAPLDQGCGILTSSTQKEIAQEFLSYLDSDKAKSILEKYGYTIPATGVAAAK